MAPAHVEAGLRYVEANPCRAGMVERPEQYRWSSAAPHLVGEKDRSGVLDLGYWERAGGVETWAELHAKAENSREIIELRKCTYAGRPFGDAGFIEEMEQRFQRKWLRGARNVGIGEIRRRVSRNTNFELWLLRLSPWPSVLPPTIGSPAVPNPVMLTYVALAVGTGGATTQATALAGIWSRFSTGSGPANVLTWDGRTMSYYSRGFRSCATTATPLVQNEADDGTITTSGQCGAFVLLLESALAMNGIHSSWIQIDAAYQPTGPAEWSKLVIKNWCFIGGSGCPIGSPSYPDQSPWIYKLILNVGDYMFPPRSGGYGDLTNLAGVQGQGEDGTTSPAYTPVEKVFDYHFIVWIPTLDGATTIGNQFYDPSYGVTYASQADFESQAVAGYAYEFPGDVGTGSNHVFTPISGSPNIAFSVNSSRSM